MKKKHAGDGVMTESDHLRLQHQTARRNSLTAFLGLLSATLLLVTATLGIVTYRQSEKTSDAQSRVVDQRDAINNLQRQIDALKKENSTLRQSQSSTPSANTESSAPPAFPIFLTDTDPVAGDSVQFGLAMIDGHAYGHSFIANLCLGDAGASISAQVPVGASDISGTLGYEDNSFSKEDTGSGGLNGMIIESTSDPASLDDDARTWFRLDDLALRGDGHETVPFTESLPEGTVTVRLRPDGYACSTTVAWGDPTFTD